MFAIELEHAHKKHEHLKVAIYQYTQVANLVSTLRRTDFVERLVLLFHFYCNIDLVLGLFWMSLWT